MKPLFSLRDLPIRRKLMVVILMTTSFALLLMGSALIVYEGVTFRRGLEMNITVLGKIIGANSTAALAFDDPKNAQEILSALAAEKQVTAAAIYDRGGQLFASFPDHRPADQFPTRPGSYTHAVENGHLVLFQPIMQEGSRLGTIYLRADLGELYARFRAYGVLLLLVAACAFLAALALSARMQRSISRPILDLAEVATAVSQRHDYSVRAEGEGPDEIGQLTKAFNEMLARIGESRAALAKSEEELRFANNEKDHFLAVLSHELRTPLTPVLATLSLLEQDQEVSLEMRRELEMIRRNIEVEARLIDDLLDITGIARGKLEMNRRVVDVRALLEHAINNYCARTAARKKIRISIDVTAKETHALVDTSRVTQVFWNILQNACKFTPEGGSIDVRVFNEPAATSTNGVSANDQPELVVEINDTGMGIPAESLSRIFNAFEQGDRSRTRVYGGLGLGLAISRAIVGLHGGSINAASEGQDRGSKFTVRLQTVHAEQAVGRDQAPLNAADSAAAQPLRVLVVEDHADTAEQFARLLTRAGHQVVCASGVREAKTVAQANEAVALSFDVMISDLDLPDGSGRDLMRDLSANSPIRGIAVSGHGMKEDIARSIDAGFSIHLTKPINWQELKKAIEKIARETPARLETERVG